jgi:CSLREA domain-containing protein
MNKYGSLVTALALILCLAVLPTSAVRDPHQSFLGPDYVVNSTADPGDGTCNSTQCTLREAITQANGDGKATIIAFDIRRIDGGYDSSTGVWTIHLASDLPALTEDGTAVMGSTQTANRGDRNPYGPEIAVNGASSYDCFDLRSAYNTIEGLAINACTDGIGVYGSGAHDNHISGNYIGLDAQGTAASGNTQNGIYMYGASDNIVGGDTANDRNIVSGNTWRGVDIYGAGADRNLIKGNYIGTDSSGGAGVGNAWNGVQIQGGQDNQIGPDNIIAYNGGGVYLAGSTTIYNTITKNSIHSNLWGGITLSDGANGSLPAPTINGAMCIAGGALSGPNLQWEAFSDFDGQGRFYESTGGTSTGSFSFYPAGDLFNHPHVTLTVTDGSGNTSEFSTPVRNGCEFFWVPLSLKRY